MAGKHTLKQEMFCEKYILNGEDMQFRLDQIKSAFDTLGYLRSKIDGMRGGKMTDLTLIPPLYAAYSSIARTHDFRSDSRNGNSKQFFLIILILYAPEAIFGGPIRRSLRSAIASVLKLKSGNIVYAMRDKAVVWYCNYSNFKEEVDIAFKAMCGNDRAEFPLSQTF